MSDLSKTSGDNVGGARKLQLIKLSDLYTFPDHVDYVIEDEIEVYDTLDNVIDVYFTPGTLSASDGEIDNNKGEAYKHKISFIHPKDTSTKLQWIEEHKQEEFIAVITTTNNIKKVYGTPDYPITLKGKRTLPGGYDGRPAWSIELEGMNLEPSLFFTDVIDYAIVG